MDCNYTVTCCSTADMNADFYTTNGLPYACLHVKLNGVDYKDDCGKTIPFDEFYKMMDEGATPTTSQVNVEEYTEIFEPILKQGKNVLHIEFSSGLSGTINSAMTAKAQLEEKYPNQTVYVLDSLCASSGYGLLVTKACELRDGGMGYTELIDWLESNKLRVNHWFFSTDLSSYFRGGRITRRAALFGTALHICPLLNMDAEGKLVPVSKFKGKKRVMRGLIAQMEQRAQDGLNYSGKCYISNSECMEDARAVALTIEERFPNLDGKVLINSVGMVIGSHTGPGTVALFFFGETRKL